MTCRAVDEVSLRIGLQVLHLRELLIDRPVHYRHFSRRAFRPFVVAREVLFHMAVRAGYAQGATVAEVHDQQ